MVVGIATFSGGHSLGDSTVHNYPEWFYGGIQIGPTSNVIQNIIQGSCLSDGNTSAIANTSETLTCSVTSAKVGDKVFVSSPDGSITSNNNGFVVLAARVELPNVITFDVGNLTLATSTPTRDYNYVIFR